MNKKSMWPLSVLVIVVLVVVGYLVFHKSPKKNTGSNANTTSSSQSASSVNNSLLLTKSNSSLGSYLTDPEDNALYTDGSGSQGVTNCNSQCLSIWPIYQDKGATTGLPTNVGTIKRSDNGEVQYTYKNKPLYYFASDTKGQVTGNGVSGFYVATP